MFTVILTTALLAGGQTPAFNHGCYASPASCTYSGSCSAACFGSYGSYGSYGHYGCSSSPGCYYSSPVTIQVVPVIVQPVIVQPVIVQPVIVQPVIVQPVKPLILAVPSPKFPPYGPKFPPYGPKFPPYGPKFPPYGPKPSPSDTSTEKRLEKIEQAIEVLADAMLKLQKEIHKGKQESDEVRLNTPAKVTVHLPAAASLYVDGVLCPQSSAVRSFDTPELQSGQQYTYTLRVEGAGQNLSKQVFLQAGQHLTVNFNADATVSTDQD